MWAQGDLQRAEINQGKARSNRLLKQVTTRMDDVTLRDKNNNSDDVTKNLATGDEKLDHGNRFYSASHKGKVVLTKLTNLIWSFSPTGGINSSALRSYMR